MVGPFGHVAAQWQPIIVLVSIGSMLLGSFAAIGQTNIKRLMAYSCIGHMGYALVGLAAGTEAGVRGVLMYLLTYVAMSAGAFACIIAMRRQGRAVEKISDLAGLAKTDLPLAALFTIFMFSMAGIPPMAGFFGKLYVFLAAVQAGLWPLAIIGVLTSVVGCFYYIRDHQGDVLRRAGAGVRCAAGERFVRCAYARGVYRVVRAGAGAGYGCGGGGGTGFVWLRERQGLF